MIQNKRNNILTPWHDEGGNLKFPYQPLRDLVFIFPTPPPERIGSESLLFIPEGFKKRHQDKTGVILAVGLGYYDKKGKFHPAPSELKPGTKVFFDNSTPWGQYLLGLDGKQHFVFLCGVCDVFGVVE
jgi:co-chaperonin GroES (HSP10)